MATYTPPTAREIFRRLAARIVARTSLTDLHEAGELAQIIAAVASALHEVAQGILTLRNQRVLRVLTGEDLDAFALECVPEGQQRGAGTRATTYGYFSRSGTVGALAIPKASVVGRSDGVAYQSTAASTIADGDSDSPTVTVIAQQVGTSGNGAAGSIVRVVSATPPGLTWTHTAAATGGTDAEGDDAFRARIIAYLRSLARANRSAIAARAKQATLETGEQVTFAKSYPGAEAGQSILYVDDGTGLLSGSVDSVPSEEFTASALGTETVFYTQQFPLVSAPEFSKDGTPLVLGTDYRVDLATGAFVMLVPTVATSVYALASGYQHWTGLVKKAHDLIYGDASDPVNFPPYVADGVSILVQGCVSTVPTIAGTLRVRPGYTPETVQENVIAAIVALVNALDIGETLYTGQIVAAAMGVAGALDFDLTAPTTDQTPGQSRVLRATTDNVTVTTD